MNNLEKRRMQLKFNSRFNFLNKSWRWFPPECRRTGLESVNTGITRCLDLLIVNIETIISKYFKENVSITQSCVGEMNNIFVLERNKKDRRTNKLMRTDQNLPRSCFYYVVSVVYLTHRIFLTPRHIKDIKPAFCRSLSSILLQYMPFKLRRN